MNSLRKKTPADLIFLRINSCPEERCFPAIHIILRITCQFYLAKILVHVPVQINMSAREKAYEWHTLKSQHKFNIHTYYPSSVS